MNTCKFHRANKKLATTGPGKCVIHLFYVILFIKLSDKPFSFYLLSCYDRDCYFDKNWSSSKPSVLSLLLLSLKLSGNIAEKAKYPTPAPASTAAPNQALYVITINISTYPTNTCTVWRNVCRMCILLFHLVLKKNNKVRAAISKDKKKGYKTNVTNVLCFRYALFCFIRHVNRP